MTKSKAYKILDNLIEKNTETNPVFFVSIDIGLKLEDQYKGIEIIKTNTLPKRTAFIASGIN